MEDWPVCAEDRLVGILLFGADDIACLVQWGRLLWAERLWALRDYYPQSTIAKDYNWRK